VGKTLKGREVIWKVREKEEEKGKGTKRRWII
jgi:hypothetical protein